MELLQKVYSIVDGKIFESRITKINTTNELYVANYNDSQALEDNCVLIEKNNEVGGFFLQQG